MARRIKPQNHPTEERAPAEDPAAVPSTGGNAPPERNPAGNPTDPHEPDTNKTSEQGEPPPRFAPETLAALAIQLLHLKGRESGLSFRPDNHLSDERHDWHFSDALKRAESVLRAAAVGTDEEVHVYQLFKEDDKPMSIGDVEKLLGKYWSYQPVYGTLRTDIEKILYVAKTEIDRQMEGANQQFSRQMGYPASLDHIGDRLETYLRRITRTTDLGRLLPDPGKFVESGSAYLKYLMGRQIPDAFG